MNSNYPLWLIKSCYSHCKANHRVLNSDTSDEAKTSFVVLPYVKGVTERVSAKYYATTESKWVFNRSARCALASQDQRTNSPQFSPDVWYTKLIVLTVTSFTKVKPTKL